MKKYKIYQSVYNAQICYLVGGTIKEVISYLKRVHKKDYKMYSWDEEFVWTDDADTTDGYQFHVTAPLGLGEVFYVWVSEANQYILFHETFHLVGDILYNRGMPYTYETEEGYAYLGGWIFDKIISLIKKDNEKQKLKTDGEES